MERLRAVVGIFAHNEQSNIGQNLDAVIAQDLGDHLIQEIVVVSSGSTDETNTIVLRKQEWDSRIRLIHEPHRTGKLSAINLFLMDHERADVVIISSADVIPDPGSFRILIDAFENSQVGMCAGRPRPVNDPTGFWGFGSHLLWEAHHRVSLKNPKLGEVVAFRDIIDELPMDFAVDEALLEAHFLSEGMELQYCPDATLRNRGPSTLKDFMAQRRRIAAGHLDLARRYGYRVSTLGLWASVKAIPWNLIKGPRRIVYAGLFFVLLLVGRALGRIDFYLLRKNHVLWSMIPSTKGKFE